MNYFKKICFFPILFIALVFFIPTKTSGAGKPANISPLIKKARDHLNLFHYDQAESLLKQAIKTNPDNYEPYFLMGKSLWKQKKVAEAEKYLTKAHELNPDEFDCQKALGAVYIAMAKESQKTGNTEQMLNHLHKACKAYPAGTKIWLTLFKNWWNSGQLDKITSEAEFIVRRNKRLLDQGDDIYIQQVLVIAAKAFFQKGDIPQAENMLNSAQKIQNTNDELYSLKREIKAKAEENAQELIDKAKQARDSGNFDEALNLLDQASKTTNSSEVHEIIDSIQRESGIRKYLLEADKLRKADKLEEALEKLEDASMQYPEDERITNLFAVTSKEVEKIHLEQAEKNAKLIAEKRRRLEKANKLKNFVKDGKKYEKEKNYELAIISYEKALEITPGNKNIKKQIDSLKKAFEEKKKRQNNYAIAKTELEHLISERDHDQAYSKAQSIIEEFPKNQNEIAPLIAEICLKLGKISDAKQYCTQFEDSEEHKKIYFYIRGMAAYHEGERDKALEYLKKLDSSFRSDISSTKRSIYLYKYQLGIYILLLGLAFPIFKFIKGHIARFKMSAMLRKIDKIRETSNYEANLDFLEERFEKEDVPNPKQITIMLAEALLRTGDTKRAYSLISNLLKRDNKNPNARRIAGEACLLLEDITPIGLEHIQNLYKIDETRKDVVEYLANVYMKQQADHKLAQDFILKYISLYPNNVDATLFLAEVFKKRQSYSQQSIKIFERAIKAAPDNPEYYSGLIANYKKLENNDMAEKILEVARSRFPDDPAFSNAPPSTSPTGAFNQPAGSYYPDYDNIGNSSQPATGTGGLPDYDNIGANPNAGQTPSTESLPPLTPQVNDPEQVSGPAKICPHCQAANSVKEYYCSTCGKPL
jgi:tetratricopeptide (TPR) repeat protein